MIESKTKTIGNHDYRVTQLGALKGRKVLTRLFKVIGPVVAAAVSGGQNLAHALDGVDEDTVEYLCDAFAARTEVDGVALDKVFEIHFAGNYAEMVKWLAFCVEFNFASFLDEFKKAQKQEASSPAE